MYIRQLNPEDAAEYRRIRIEAADDPAFASDPLVESAMSVDLLRKVLANPRAGEILGAFEDGALIGIIGLGRSEMHRTGTVYGLFISPGLRSKGYGRALVRALLARVSQYGELNALELLVQASNKVAKGLYEAEGFETEVDSGHSTLLMRLCF